MNEATISGSNTTLNKADSEKDKFSRNFRPKADNINPVKVNSVNSAKVNYKRKKKKAEKKSRKLLLILFIFIILIGAAVAALYFSGLLIPLLQNTGLVEETTTEQSLQAREKALDKREAELKDKEEELENLEATLAQRKAELEKQANSTDDGNKAFEEVLSGLSEDKLKEIKNVATIYGNMEPAKAADILKNIYGDTEISLIIYHMKPAASALVLEQMDTELGAALTKIMLG